MCYGDQIANVPNKLKKDDVPRKTISLTTAEEAVVGKLAKSIRIQELRFQRRQRSQLTIDSQIDEAVSNMYNEYGHKLQGPAVEDLASSNDTKIPMDPDTKLVKAEDGNSVDATYYRSLIGSLRYLLHTRPDLSYSVRLLSRFMQDPKDHHLKAIKQVIRYIKGIKEHGIIYKKEGGCKITGYNDSSYGINTDQGKGTTRIVFYFGESPITWCTQKQPMVALSSCESKFMAATGAACQALWLK
nr:ribonuclease H-like domain, reverse transcriptase, RNA-dependent DNA polymerase [Tanacetum cinerariifolium]